MESRIQHAATPFGARLQAAGAGGLQPMGSTQSSFTVYGCDINFLTHRGTKTRASQLNDPVILSVPHENGGDLSGSAIPGNNRAELAVFL